MDRRTLELQANQLESTLVSYRCPGRVTGGTITPRWIRFDVIPARGVKVDNIKALAEDLARTLGAPGIRVDRRGVKVAVEIPRDDPQPVRLLPLLRQLDDNFPDITAVLGLEDNGTPLLIRLPSPDVAHILVAGTTGSGKTALLRTMALGLALHHPHICDLALVLIDPRGGAAFDCLGGLPHLVRPVICDTQKTTEMLGSLTRLMATRDAERVVKPPIIIFIDELADLLMTGGDDVKHYLTRLTQRGRGVGIHIVAATQKPTAAVLGSLFKANFPVRLIGKVTSPQDAAVAAGMGGTGAERLEGRGDFLAVAEGRVTRFQAAYISKAELAQVLACRRWEAPPRSTGSEPVRAGGQALHLSSIRPFPYRQMDDRLAFCGAVRDFCKGLPRDTDGCTSYPKCDLTGGGPCAFDDPDFDWERAKQIAATQPLIVDSTAKPEPEPVDVLTERLQSLDWDPSESYRSAARALGEAEGGRRFYLVQEAVDRLREGREAATATATASPKPPDTPTAPPPLLFAGSGSDSDSVCWQEGQGGDDDV